MQLMTAFALTLKLRVSLMTNPNTKTLVREPLSVHNVVQKIGFLLPSTIQEPNAENVATTSFGATGKRT